VLQKCTSVEMGPDHQAADGSMVPTLAIEFAPLRPMRALVQVLVTNEVGGRWRFRMDLHANAPEADDEIQLVSTLKKTSSVAFHLTNRTAEEAVFSALIFPESQRAFAVSPPQGILVPYGSNGTRFQVDFTPSEYGKYYEADLIIDTDEMQWIYRLVGSFPAYQAPRNTASKVDSYISEQVDEKLLHKNRRNFFKENMSAVRTGPPA